MNHGLLNGGQRDQSVLIFQIGEYVFCEWSHTGKLRVLRAESNNNQFFGKASISRENIVYSSCVEEWVHASPQTFNWQNRVSEWIRNHCGISKTQKDWM